MSVVHGWPLSDKARAAVAALNSGRSQQTVGCTPIPLPMVAMLAMLRTIDVRDDRVVMKIDSDGSDATRTIYLDLAEHPANVEPSLFGHSIGRWDGDTLVIDTVAFTPHRIGIGFGVPSGTGKHLIERLTLTADRLQLRYELTVEDPEYLTAPRLTRRCGITGRTSRPVPRAIRGIRSGFARSRSRVDKRDTRTIAVAGSQCAIVAPKGSSRPATETRCADPGRFLLMTAVGSAIHQSQSRGC
jgi:hypothetical protein